MAKPSPEAPRGFVDLQQETISWNGETAVYSVAERELMSGLSRHEASVIHALKATFSGEIREPTEDARLENPSWYYIPNDKRPAPAPPKRRRRHEPLPGQTDLM